MTPKVVLFQLATLLLISSSSVSAHIFQVENTNPGPEFCNWVVQTWPTGYGYARTDVKRNLSDFTIHGRWPVGFNGEGLDIPIGHHMERDDICKMIQNHPQSAQFSTDMITYWPSLRLKYNVDLWSNEWNKHGRYQNSLVPAAYFINTIQVVKLIKLMETLAEEGIIPSNSNPYPRGSYIRAITKRTQVGDPLLLCNPTAYNGFQVLEEVVICVDTITNSFVPCPVQPGYQRLCHGPKIWFLAL